MYDQYEKCLRIIKSLPATIINDSGLDMDDAEKMENAIFECFLESSNYQKDETAFTYLDAYTWINQAVWEVLDDDKIILKLNKENMLSLLEYIVIDIEVMPDEIKTELLSYVEAVRTSIHNGMVDRKALRELLNEFGRECPRDELNEFGRECPREGWVCFYEGCRISEYLGITDDMIAEKLYEMYYAYIHPNELSSMFNLSVVLDLYDYYGCYSDGDEIRSFFAMLDYEDESPEVKAFMDRLYEFYLEITNVPEEILKKKQKAIGYFYVKLYENEGEEGYCDIRLVLLTALATVFRRKEFKKRYGESETVA